MLKRILIGLGLAVGGLLLIVVIVGAVFYSQAEARLNRVYTVKVEALAVPGDKETLARGQAIANTVCTNCHGDNLGGGVVMDAPGFAVVNAPNLTSGPGGVAADEYKTDEDWVRAIRHGIDPDGKSLLLMPSEEFSAFSDADLGAVIAYIKAVPAVNHSEAGPELSLMVKLLLGAGRMGNFDAAAAIDHSATRPAPPQPGVTVAYGQYLVTTRVCRDCHGADLAGEANPDPSGPYVPNITPNGDFANWKSADFFRLMRNGVQPSGKTISLFMPWRYYAHLSDDELKAMWLYLQSVPPVKK